VTVVLDLDNISPTPALDLTSVLTALAHVGVDSVVIARHAPDAVEVKRFSSFDEALDSIRAVSPKAYVIAIGAADEHAAATLHDSQLGIELCAFAREQPVDREAVRDFLWWVIEARYAWPAWAPPLDALVDRRSS
jgi:hypothetical protein